MYDDAPEDDEDDDADGWGSEGEWQGAGTPTG